MGGDGDIWQRGIIREVELSPLEAALAKQLRDQREVTRMLLGTLEMFHELILPRSDRHIAELRAEIEQLRDEMCALRRAAYQKAAEAQTALDEVKATMRRLVLTKDAVKRLCREP